MEIRRLVLGLAILTLAVVIAGIIVLGREAQVPTTDEAVASDSERLEATLWELKRNYLPEPRARLLRQAADRIDELRAPLLDFLSTPPHPLLKEAIDLAVALELTDAQPAMAELAETGPDQVRSAAILAGERLGPWSRDELEHFLKQGTGPALVAALEVSSSRSDRPLIAIIKLLTHEGGAVSEAAMNAIPNQITPVQLGEIVAAAQKAPPDEAAQIIRALGKTESVGSLESFLLRQLDRPEHSIRMAALDALGNKGSQLSSTVPVWKLVSYGETAEGAKALMCLEKTKSFRASKMRAQLPRLNPFLRYFAARCLITAGDREGVGVLIDILQADEGDFFGVEDDQAETVVLASRKLLADLSNLGTHADLKALRQWYASLTAFGPRPLRPPPMDL